jgi:hypothetical protein
LARSHAHAAWIGGQVAVEEIDRLVDAGVVVTGTPGFAGESTRPQPTAANGRSDDPALGQTGERRLVEPSNSP